MSVMLVFFGKGASPKQQKILAAGGNIATSSTQSQSIDSVSSTSTSHLYTNVPLHLSIELPSYLTIIDEAGWYVGFKDSQEGPWMLGISAEETKLKTTNDWIATQPKGSSSSKGITFIKWIGPQTDGKALLAQYVQVDQDGNKPILGIVPIVMVVKNGTLYTINIHKQFAVNETPTLDPELMNALETLQVSGLVTTDAAGSYVIIKNTACGVTFHAPSGWENVGMLFGGVKIVSPENKRTNEEWAKAHQYLIDHEEGDAPLGPDARTFSMSCFDTIDAYKNNMSGLLQYNDFEKAQNLAEVITSSIFHTTSTEFALVKTININGQNAYEISQTIKGGDGIWRTFYEIVLEKGKIYDFGLGLTEYDKLSEAAKKIIQSISFEK